MKLNLTWADLSTLTATQRTRLRNRFPSVAHAYDWSAEGFVLTCTRCGESVDFSGDEPVGELRCLLELNLSELWDIALLVGITRNQILNRLSTAPANMEPVDELFAFIKSRVA